MSSRPVSFPTGNRLLALSAGSMVAAGVATALGRFAWMDAAGTVGWATAVAGAAVGLVGDTRTRRQTRRSQAIMARAPATLAADMPLQRQKPGP